MIGMDRQKGEEIMASKRTHEVLGEGESVVQNG